MNTQSAALEIEKDLKVSTCLRSLHDTERIFLAWNGKINFVIGSDLQEDSVVAAAFICLSCRMKKSRTKAETCRSQTFVQDLFANFPQLFFIFRVHPDIREQPEIIVCTQTRYVCLKIRGKRTILPDDLVQSRDIRLIAEQRRAVFFIERGFVGK